MLNAVREDVCEAVREAAGEHLLLLDFSGERPLLALAAGGKIRQTEMLAERSAAAEWLPAVRRLLGAERWLLSDLHGVGVIGGPGSFTGVRTGVAGAKGLCEAAALPLAVVSRLAVLALAAEETHAVAVLYAGRDQVYCRVPARQGHAATEELLSLEELEASIGGPPVVITEPRLLPSLAAFKPRLVPLGAEQILAVVQGALLQGGSSVPEADAHYVRREDQIYRRTGSPQL